MAQTLNHFAHLHSVTKGGVVQELNRIHAYLRPAGLPCLKVAQSADGKTSLIEIPPKKVDDAVAEGLQPYLDKRRSKSARTIAFRASLANKKVNVISKAEFDRFVATMKQDGASESQVQKEIALLKAVINKAIERWNWVGF